MEGPDADWVDPGYPAEIVRELLPWLGDGGTALDLASGGGRNARVLAGAGWRVLAVDLSAEGLRRTGDLGPGVQPVRAELPRFAMRPGSVDLVLKTFYLERALFPFMRKSLRPGGYVAVETYSVLELEELGGDVGRDFVLDRGELLEAFAGFRILLHQEGIFEREEGERGLARLIARKPPAP